MPFVFSVDLELRCERGKQQRPQGSLKVMGTPLEDSSESSRFPRTSTSTHIPQETLKITGGQPGFQVPCHGPQDTKKE